MMMVDKKLTERVLTQYYDNHKYTLRYNAQEDFIHFIVDDKVNYAYDLMYGSLQSVKNWTYDIIFYVKDNEVTFYVWGMGEQLERGLKVNTLMTYKVNLTNQVFRCLDKDCPFYDYTLSEINKYDEQSFIESLYKIENKYSDYEYLLSRSKIETNKMGEPICYMFRNIGYVEAQENIHSKNPHNHKLQELYYKMLTKEMEKAKREHIAYLEDIFIPYISRLTRQKINDILTDINYESNYLRRHHIHLLILGRLKEDKEFMSTLYKRVGIDKIMNTVPLLYTNFRGWAIYGCEKHLDNCSLSFTPIISHYFSDTMYYQPNIIIPDNRYFDLYFKFEMPKKVLDESDEEIVDIFVTGAWTYESRIQKILGSDIYFKGLSINCEKEPYEVGLETGYYTKFFRTPMSVITKHGGYV